jgi:hypothetical protein
MLSCDEQVCFYLSLHASFVTHEKFTVVDIQSVSQVQMEIMKAVSFMYVRPPGYNAESAKAAEIEDEKRRSGEGDATQSAAAASTSSM